MLLDDMISAKPGEVIPISHLVLHIAPLRLTFFHPNWALIPVSPRRHNLPDGAIMDLLERLQISRLVVALSAGTNEKPFGFGFFVDRKAGSDAWPVNGDRLFSEDVFAGCDRGLEVGRSKSRWCG